MSTNKIVLAVFCLSLLGACSASQHEEWFVTHNGNMPAEERIARVEKGFSQDEVMQILGAPSSVVSFDENTWLYMSSDIKRIAFSKPEEVDRNILKITFDANGNVAQITRLTKADGREITPDEEKTAVNGQDPGFFRKYFGGVGQYNPFAGQNSGANM